ncbi:MAG: helix-turn-helix domain-containing protein [Selenomonadaceae bacterium]|nr:helix-turn-helix domain-containing protein [Selenomonadaceae bacterium]
MRSKNLSLMTVREVCERLQISRNMAYSLLKRSDLEVVKVGRMWRIPDRSILSYITRSNNRKECIYNEQEDRKEPK